MKKTTNQSKKSPFKPIKQEEVDFLDEQAGKIADYRKGRGTPDYVGFEYHYMVLAISNLRAQERLEKLTWALILLTIVLTFLTAMFLLKELNL